MALLNTILTWIMKKRIDQITFFTENPHQVQEDTFRKLVHAARDTEWGRQYGYADAPTPGQFRERVPLSTYEDLFPRIERLMKGEQNILWPSEIKWFAKSSGTTNARSKFIPVSTEALEDCHFRGGKDLMTLFIHNRPDTKVFTGKGLSIGGSLQSTAANVFSGDVSAVVMKNLPIWAQFIRTPQLEVALMDKWEEKLDKMAHITAQENVTSILGVPTWTIVLLEKVLALTGKSSILDVWPNLEVFAHGAVSFGPYRELFTQKLISSLSVDYMEIYNASEGFFGIQDDLSRPDEMLLMLDYGVFYEFIPLEEVDWEHPRTLGLEEVELNRHYALVISTNAGLWRYKIGDTIRFTSLHPHRIKITGRTKHFINAFGEEVIIENAEAAITRACQQTGAVVGDFTAGPVYMEGGKRGRHEWIIEFTRPPARLAHFTQVLDSTLRDLNSDYDAKRYQDMALRLPLVHHVPEGTFYRWMKKRGKLGGQHKVPRLANSREYLDDLLKMVAERAVNSG
ncbi:MAG: GH3 auxin-responsive promoter family protein [Ferruginibacter sp.]|nr:GH3 auxin-responsive promoter family protein [Cytophagales bacterium]